MYESSHWDFQLIILQYIKCNAYWKVSSSFRCSWRLAISWSCPCDSSHLPKKTKLRAEYTGKQMISFTWMHIYIQNEPTNSWEVKKTMQYGSCGRDFWMELENSQTHSRSWSFGHWWWRKNLAISISLYQWKCMAN